MMIFYSNLYNQINISFPIVAFSVNVSLMAIRNITFEMRQRKITNKINNQLLEYLMITIKFKRF